MGKGTKRSGRQVSGTATSLKAQAKFQQALAAHQQGQLDNAETSYREALRSQPGYFEALLFLGHLYLQQGRIREAGEATGKAIAINRHHPVAHFNLGMTRLREGAHAEAMASFDRAITLYPEYSEAHNNRGSVLQTLGRHDEAVAAFDRAIALDPNNDFAHNNRGISQQKLGQHLEAIASFDRALAIADNNAVTQNNRGISLMALDRYEEAIASFERALVLGGDYLDAMVNCATALSRQGRHGEALARFDQILVLTPDNAIATNNRGMALLNMGRNEEAIADFRRASEQSPGYFHAYNNLGLALENLRRYDEALASYRQALTLEPEDAVAHLNLGLVLLRNMDLPAGWHEFEWRWKTEQLRGAHRDFSQPLWLGGESLQGRTILLHGEQGLGDTIQFCRYARLVAALGAKVFLEVQAGLEPILATLEGVERLFVRGQCLPAFDYHCPLLSLPLAFRTEPSTIPAADRYLRADPGRVAVWRSRLGESRLPRTGLVWSGSTVYGNDQNRSLPLSCLARLPAETRQWVSLQKEIRPADKRIFDERNDILHFGGELRDFGDTAALIELLDQVITVDTAVAHLAGALGKPVWLLLPFNADWRWFSDGNNSPWYPSARLFRQPRPGDWGSVIDSVATALAAGF